MSVIEGGEGRPLEPDWSLTYTDVLDLETARTEWRIVINELTEAQTLTVANGHAIRRLVEFRVIYERCARDLAETGALLKAKRTRVPQINPNWSIMRQASDQIGTLEAELCLTPRRRASAAKVARKPKVARASDAYLKPVAK
jgi:P27 family predicted phage terminase small subunit